MILQVVRCVLAATIIVTLGEVADLQARPSFIPNGAYWRIDRNNSSPASARGKWEELGVYSNDDGDWGQGQCVPGGNECHLYDFVTWWLPGIVVPDPGNGYTPILWGSTNFPCCYDSTNGYSY